MEDKFERGIEVTGSALIENEKGEILLTQSPNWSNKWMLPGGHIEPGETIIEGIVREGEEETGLKLQGSEIFHCGDLIDSKDYHRSAHFVYFDVYCKIIGGNVALDNIELTSYKWLLPEEALKLPLAETYKETIEKFIVSKASFHPH